MRHWAGIARDGSFLSSERVRRYAVVLLVVELAFLAICIANTHGWLRPLTDPVSTDFVSFYAAGMLANAGTPALAYDPLAHHAAEQAATEPGIAYNYFFYPPPFLLLCAGLARLPYLLSFVLFQVAGLVPCLLLARRIAGRIPLMTVLAFPAVFWTIGCGQNAMLTASLLAGATLILHRHPLAAGLLLGLLCYKPHLALLVPVALVAGGYWRTLAAAALSAAGLVALSFAVWGQATWRAFLAASAAAPSIYGSTGSALDLAGLTSPFGLGLALGADERIAAALQVAIFVGVAVAVAWAWRAPLRPALRNAVLLAGIPVATPIVMFYDLLISGLALAWLFRDGRENGFPPWQRTALALLWLLPLFTGNSGFAAQIGRPPLASLLTLAFALRQALVARTAVDGWRRGVLAERVGFEPTVGVNLQRFSRPPP